MGPAGTRSGQRVPLDVTNKELQKVGEQQEGFTNELGMVSKSMTPEEMRAAS